MEKFFIWSLQWDEDIITGRRDFILGNNGVKASKLFLIGNRGTNPRIYTFLFSFGAIYCFIPPGTHLLSSMWVWLPMYVLIYAHRVLLICFHYVYVKFLKLVSNINLDLSKSLPDDDVLIMQIAESVSGMLLMVVWFILWLVILIL